MKEIVMCACRMLSQNEQLLKEKVLIATVLFSLTIFIFLQAQFG